MTALPRQPPSAGIAGAAALRHVALQPAASVAREDGRRLADGHRAAARSLSRASFGLAALVPLTARWRRRNAHGVRTSTRSRLRSAAGDLTLKLPPSACKGEISGVEVYLIGTAHISAQSAKDVEDLVSTVQPDALVVELSRDRIGSLYPDQTTQSRTGSLQLDLDHTPAGFPVVLRAKSSDTGEDGQLIVRNVKDDKVDVMKMRRPLSSFSDGKWLETAFEKHRYRSDGIQIWPAIELMATLANQLFPLVQQAFYSSVSQVSHSGGEFAAAARVARASGCPIILGDVENEDLFDPLGALEVTREDPLWVRLGGPLVRPNEGGVDLIEALKHVFAGVAKPGTGARIGALYFIILSYGFYLDAQVGAVDFSSVLPLMFAMSMSNTLVAGAIVFLLTATRDEQLFRALEEAALEVVEKKGHGRVVLVCGVAHVNGIARYIAKAQERTREKIMA